MRRSLINCAYCFALVFGLANVRACAEDADPRLQACEQHYRALQEQLEAIQRENRRMGEDVMRVKGEFLKQQQEAIIAKENLTRTQNEMNDTIEERVKQALEKSPRDAADKETTELRVKVMRLEQAAKDSVQRERDARSRTEKAEIAEMEHRQEYFREFARQERKVVEFASMNTDQRKAELIPTFIELLKARMMGERWQSIIILGQFGPDAKAALPALTECMKEDDPLIRILAAEAFWCIEKNPQHVSGLLLESLKKDAATRTTCSAILARIGAEDERIVTALADDLADKDEEVAWQAGMALRHIGKKANAAIPALKTATKDDRKRVALIATEALKEIEK